MKFKCSECGNVIDKCNIKCSRCGNLINCFNIIERNKEEEDE